MNSLKVTNASKKFGQKLVLDSVSLKINTEEILGVFGRNGSGKSTLLKLIFGVETADSISIKINEKAFLPKEIIPSQKIAYLPQDNFLSKNYTVRNIIPLLFPNGDDQDKIFYSKGVAKFENTKIGNLSMGERRFLEILLIGNMKHDFLMLDEPFSMVEPLKKDAIKELLLELKKKKGIILTDHYYDDVLQITDSNLLLENGKQIQIENASDLKRYGYLKSL